MTCKFTVSTYDNIETQLNDDDCSYVTLISYDAFRPMKTPFYAGKLLSSNFTLSYNKLEQKYYWHQKAIEFMSYPEVNVDFSTGRLTHKCDEKFNPDQYEWSINYENDSHGTDTLVSWSIPKFYYGDAYQLLYEMYQNNARLPQITKWEEYCQHIMK